MRVIEKTCSKCGKTQSIDEFHRHTDSPDGRQYECRTCRNIAKQVYNRTHPSAYRGEEYEGARQRKYRASKKNRIKINARRKLAYAVETGKVVKPSSCSECSSTERMHGHHEDYTDALNVVWLCRSCHLARHRRF